MLSSPGKSFPTPPTPGIQQETPSHAGLHRRPRRRQNRLRDQLQPPFLQAPTPAPVGRHPRRHTGRGAGSPNGAGVSELMPGGNFGRRWTNGCFPHQGSPSLRRRRRQIGRDQLQPPESPNPCARWKTSAPTLAVERETDGLLAEILGAGGPTESVKRRESNPFQ